jgi:hypothetical protein
LASFYFDFRSEFDIEPAGSRSLIKCQFNKPGAALDRKKLAGLCIREGSAQTMDVGTRHPNDKILLQIVRPEICDHVAELIYPQDRSDQSIFACNTGPWNWPFDVVDDTGPD